MFALLLICGCWNEEPPIPPVQPNITDASIDFSGEPVTAAILPWVQGGGGEEYAGLGFGLAGMFSADFSKMDPIQLVERERIDDILGEISLSETGYLDPTTAQQLGRGLGAELIITGSYNMLGGNILLDGRIVRVEDGAVLKAEAQQGPVDDFVAVQKALVTELLTRLDLTLSATVQRRLMIETPTEKFEAIQHYGKGRALEVKGDKVAAQAEFEASLRSDPDFVAAQQELAKLRALVGDASDDLQKQLETVTNNAHKRVLTEITDERNRPTTFRHNSKTRTEFALRLLILKKEGQHCQMYDEMVAYGNHHSWRIPRDSGLERRLAYLARDYGLEVDIEASRHITIVHDSEIREITRLWASSNDFVVGDMGLAVNRRGLVAPLNKCHTPAERLVKLAELESEIIKVKAGNQIGGYEDSGLRLDEMVSLKWCWIRARHFGADDRLSQRVRVWPNL